MSSAGSPFTGAQTPPTEGPDNTVANATTTTLRVVTSDDDDDDDDDDEEEVKDDAGCALTLSTLKATDHMDDDDEDDVASGDLFVTKPDKSTSTVGEDDEVEYESEASTVMSKVMLNRNVWPTEMVGV